MKDGMVNHRHQKKCSHQGCTKKIPSFGAAGSKKRELCAGHTKDGMVNVYNRQCVHEGCSKEPTFGL